MFYFYFFYSFSFGAAGFRMEATKKTVRLRRIGYRYLGSGYILVQGSRILVRFGVYTGV